MRLAGRVYLLSLVAIMLSACATPTQTAIPVTSVPPSLGTFDPTVTRPPRTALPSVTPTSNAVAAPNTAVSVASTATSVPAGLPVLATGSTTGATQAQPTAQPSSTSALIALTPNMALTPLPSQGAILEGVPPPLTIQLPQSWRAYYQIVPTRAPLIQANMNMAVYRGPVKGGTGVIILLWGFPSLGPPPTMQGLQSPLTQIPGTPGQDLRQQMLLADGSRLLQGTIVDITCNVGNSGQRTDFSIGGAPAVGQYYSSSQCQGEPDTIGWFAGVHRFGGNFLFYMFVEPVEAYNVGRADLQTVLDTVVFKDPHLTPTFSGPPPTNTSAVIGPPAPVRPTVSP